MTVKRGVNAVRGGEGREKTGSQRVGRRQTWAQICPGSSSPPGVHLSLDLFRSVVEWEYFIKPAQTSRVAVGLKWLLQLSKGLLETVDPECLQRIIGLREREFTLGTRHSRTRVS